MKRLLIAAVACVAVALAATAARAAWVWRDNEWQYVEDEGPRLPAAGEATGEPITPEGPEAGREPSGPMQGTLPAEALEPDRSAPLVIDVASPASSPEAAPPAAVTEAAPAPPPPTPAPAREAKPSPPAPAPDVAGATGPDGELFAEGVEAYRAGDWDKAAGRFKKLLKKHPDSAWAEEAMWLRAEALFAKADYYGAFHQYEDLIGSYAGSPHYAPSLAREIEIAELYLGPVRRKVLGMPLFSGEPEALEILRRVYEHEPLGQYADDVVMRIADYHWSKGSYQEAEDYYDQYCREFPNTPAVRHAELRRAQCAIERCRGARYDTTCLQLALDRLRQYRQKYPETARAERVDDLIDRVRSMQAESLYRVAEYYVRSGEPLSAVYYAEECRKDYPDTAWSERAAALVADVSTRKE